MSSSVNIRVPNFRIALGEEDVKDILGLIRSSLETNKWVNGICTAQFEQAFLNYSGATYARAVSNGGAALVTILQGLGLRDNSIVVCPTLTAPPTPHAILSAGMRVAFVDSNPNDLSVDTNDLLTKLDRYGKDLSAVIVVHIGGWVSPRLQELRELCDSRDIPLIEDCAHAHGSLLYGQPVGQTGVAAAYSFFMTKPLTSGEGGVVTTAQSKLAEEISLIINYGKNADGMHVRKGFNYRISEFNAAVAVWATKNAPRIISQRREIAERYDDLLSKVENLRFMQVQGCQPSYYKYIVRFSPHINRDRVRNRLLHEHGIECAGGVYDRLCHEEPYFRNNSSIVLNAADQFPLAEEFSRSHLCLPLYPGLEYEAQELVARSLCDVLTSEEKQ